MVVQHNMNAINSYNRLNANVAGMKKASEKLSSGYRINRAGDDAAGLAISEKMRSQIRGINQAIRNSQDGINMIQTFEGAAQETHNILQRMKELASESANGTYDNATDRDAIQLEFDQLNDELNQIADTDFNGRVALNGGVMADGTSAANIIKPANIGETGAVSDTQDINYYKGGWTIATDDDGIVQKVTVAGNVMNITSASNTAAGEFGLDAGKITIDGVEYTSTAFTGGTNAEFADSNTISLTSGDLELKKESITMSVTSGDGSTSDVSMTYSLTKDNITYYTDAGTNWYDANGKQVATSAANFGKQVLSEDGLKITGATYASGKLTLTATLTPNQFRMGGTTDDGTKAVSVADAYDNGRRNLTYSDSITLQAGARSKDAVEFTFAYSCDGMGDLNADMDISARGLGTDQLSLSTPEDANYAIDQIDNAINKTSMVRATFGAIQNRLEHKITNLTTNNENLTEAESNIRDTDMASEMMNYTKYNILQQAAQSMLAQANQQPQSILQLLG